MKKNALSLGFRLGSIASLVACASLSAGCMVDTYDEANDAADDFDLVAEAEDELQNATNTTAFAPVVRIETPYAYCTATAIADDLLITAAHCVKNGYNVVDWVKVRIAQGANSSAQGVYSSYFMMSAQIYDNTNGTDTKRDIAIVKFGAGTFSSWYPLASVASSLNGESVVLLGFGGNDTKSYGAETVTKTSWKDANYAIAYTDNTNGTANVESGDSGGPMLRKVGTSYEVLGVLYGHVTYSSGAVESMHPLITNAVYDHLAPVLTTSLPQYCVENYQHAGFDGFGVSFCNSTVITNKFNADGFTDPFKMASHWNYGNWNDEISSMELPDNTILTVYEHSSQGGAALTLQTVFPFGRADAVSSLVDNGFNDKLSSFRMVRTTSPSNKDWQVEITRYGKCLDLSAGNTANGGNIQEWDCQSGNTNQVFRIEAVGSYYQIKHTASGKCLQAAGTSSGSNVELWSCTGGDNQLFTITSNDATGDVRDFQIRGKQSSRCMDITGGGSSNGTNIQLWGCSDTNPSQNFALKMVW